MLFCQAFPHLARTLGLRQVPKENAEFFTKVVEDTVSYREKNNVIRKDFLQLLMEIRNNKDGQENGHGGELLHQFCFYDITLLQSLFLKTSQRFKNCVDDEPRKKKDYTRITICTRRISQDVASEKLFFA